MNRFFTLSVLLFSLHSTANNSTDLVSERGLNSAGCFFVLDTSNINEVVLNCAPQSAIAGYNLQIKRIIEYNKDVSAYNSNQTYSNMKLLKKSLSASSEAAEVCRDRFRLIDELFRRGETDEILAEYQRLAPEYRNFYIEKLGCDVTLESIECKTPVDLNLLMGAVLGAHDFLKYLNFFLKYDASLNDLQKSQLKEFITSMERAYIQLRDDFHSRVKNR
jgi:hypothetical protein